MDENWTEALKEFDGVWQRVQGREHPAEAASCAAPTLEQMIRSEAEREQYYRALARLAEGRSTAELDTMAAECRENCKRLQTELFLETGNTCVPEPGPLPNDGFLGYLRRAYLRENAAAREYLEAAAGDDRALSGLYGELSGQCTRRSEKLYALVSRVLG